MVIKSLLELENYKIVVPRVYSKYFNTYSKNRVFSDLLSAVIQDSGAVDRQKSTRTQKTFGPTKSHQTLVIDGAGSRFVVSGV